MSLPNRTSAVRSPSCKPVTRLNSMSLRAASISTSQKKNSRAAAPLGSVIHKFKHSHVERAVSTLNSRGMYNFGSTESDRGIW